MRKLSPSMIVACIALFVALTGTAVAGSGLISGSSIKNHTIAASKLTPNAISFLRGRQGPAGPAGPAGSAGPAGADGGFDPAKIVYAAGPTTDLPANGTAGGQVLTATCPAGTKAVGGGGQPVIALQGFSGPTADGSGWEIIVFNDTTVDIPNAFAVAVCAGK